MKALKIIGRIFSAVLSVLLALLLICNLYTIAARFLWDDPNPSVLGFSSAVVISGSMSGAIEVNDMVVIHAQKAYAPGDVITFRSGENLVTHRLLEQTPEGYITKGDANNTPDPDPVPADAVEGKVVLVIPGMGRLMELIRTPIGMLLLAAVGFLLIEIPWQIERRKKEDHDDDR